MKKSTIRGAEPASLKESGPAAGRGGRKTGRGTLRATRRLGRGAAWQA